MKESDMYAPIKSWFEERGFIVYPEVECRSRGGRADLVVTSGPIVGVVEMKQSLSLDLIEQALRWRGYANYIWIAIPYQPKAYKKFVTMVLRDYGIGVLTVSKYRSVWTDKLPQFQRRALPDLKDSLTEHHLTSEVKGGHRGGGYVTPYRITMNNVRSYLIKQGGWRSIKEILDYCETHYASPRASLAKALQQFEGDWCEVKKESGKLHFRCRPDGKSGKKDKFTVFHLSDKQRNVLFVLSADTWQTPTLIMRKLPGVNPAQAEKAGLLYVNQPLKALVKKGFVEKNPHGRGQYRLTPVGEAMRLEFDNPVHTKPE